MFYNQIVFLLPMRPTPLRLSLLLAASLAALPIEVRADDASEIAEAVSAAQSWLAEIDAGAYEQSYRDGGPALHDKMTEDTWIKVLKTERPLMGRVISRQEIMRQRHDQLEGVPGDFVVVGFRTNFETHSDELEYIVMKHEFGMGWRGVGYDFGPEQVTNDPDANPDTTSVASTNTPPVPSNGVVVPAKRPEGH